MPMKFEMTEVRLTTEGGYCVVLKIAGQNVSSTFEISVAPRRKRHQSWTKGKTLMHHRKTFEMLQDEAKEKVLTFCKDISATHK